MLLVPALAGLMASAQPSKSQSGGSPRVRGEKTVSLSHLLQDGMFTSRARGKDRVIVSPPPRWDVHLACAGKRQSL